MDYYSRHNATRVEPRVPQGRDPFPVSQQQQQQNVERGTAFNFDMNEEFSPDLTKIAQQHQKEKAAQGGGKKKTKKRPEKLPFELTHYNRAAINFLFILIFIMCVALNFDQGIIGAASVEIKATLGIDNFQLGGLQSLIYLGLLLGQTISPIVFRRVFEKMIVIVCLIFSIASLGLYLVPIHYAITCLARFVFGFAQAFLCLYFLGWIETFGVSHQKSTWLMIQMLAPFFGYFLGYMFTALILTHQLIWQLAFVFQGVMLCACLLICIFTPERYFDIDSAIQMKLQEEQNRKGAFNRGMIKNEKEGESIEWSVYNSFGQPAVLLSSGIDKHHEISKEYQGQEGEQLDINMTQKEKIEQDLLAGMTTVGHEEGVRNAMNQPSSYEIAKMIMKNRSFLFFSLSLAGYFFVITGLQMYLTQYAQVVIGVKKDQIYMYFGVSGPLTPVFGALIGGYITTKVGGSSSPQALGILCLAAFFSTVVALPVPFVFDIIPFVLLVSTFLFLVGLILPILCGQLLYTLHQQHRVVGNSVANLLFILFGFLPAPSIYGLVSRIAQDEDKSRYPMGVLMYSTIISSAFLFIALISKLKYRRVRTNSQPKPIINYQTTDPTNQQQYYNPHREQSEVVVALKDDDEGYGEDSRHNIQYEYVDTDEGDLIRPQSYAQIFALNESSRNNVVLGDQQQHSRLSLTDQMSKALRADLQKRRASAKKKDLRLSNLDRLKFDAVHAMIGRTFIPCSLGIVNEDFYFI